MKPTKTKFEKELEKNIVSGTDIINIFENKLREANIPFESKLPIPTDVKTIQLKHVIKAKEADDKRKKSIIMEFIETELEEINHTNRIDDYLEGKIAGFNDIKKIIERHL